MDDINIFAKNEKQLEALIQTIRIYINDVRMAFVIEKRAREIMKKSKREIPEGIRLFI